MQKRIEKIMFAIAVACMGVLFTSCHTSRRVTTDDIYDNSTSVPSTGDGGQTEVKAKAGDNKKLYAEVDKWLGVPYRYGGTSRSGVDCSGLVSQLYKEVYGVSLQRNSARILQINCKEIKKSDLREGDLVFFSSRKSRSRINHVGLYLKDGKFVHAASRGVVIDLLDSPYYKTHYVASGRVKR